MTPTPSGRSTRLAVSRALASGVCLAALLLGGPGCSQAPRPGRPAAGSVPAPPVAPAPQLVSAAKNSFAEVTRHLDPGGSLYLYMGTAQFCDGLASKLETWRAPILSLPNLPPDGPTNINRAFDLVGRLVRKSGLEYLSGVGLSGIALEPGFYQTKVFLHHYPDQAAGWLWSASGRNAHPLETLSWLPADTALAGFMDLDAASLWTDLRAELVQSGFPQVSAVLDGFEAGFTRQTGLKWGEALGSVASEMGLILTLDFDRKVSIPIPAGATLSIPEPGLLLALRVKNDLLFDRLDLEFRKHTNMVALDKDGLRQRTVPVPAPIPIAPTVARVGDYLLIASNEQLVQRVLDARAGKVPGLRAGEEFTKLAKGMDLSGNQFTFISRRFSTAIAEIQKATLGGTGGLPAASAQLMEKLVRSQTFGSSLAVGSRLPDGFLTVSHGNQDPVRMLLLPAVVAPVAIMAAITVPALTQAKSKAQGIMCINNLKQIGLAARMYALDFDDTLPSDFPSLSKYLPSPVVLVCPLDRERVDPQKLTWATLQPADISYEMLLPGAKETPELAAKAIFRCRRHLHVCLGDGRALPRPPGPP